MAQQNVNLISTSPYLDPPDVEAQGGDTILFVNDTIYEFTITINNANHIFNTEKRTLLFDVPPNGTVKTPSVKGVESQEEDDYEVHIDKLTDIIPSDAPPKIIRIP